MYFGMLTRNPVIDCALLAWFLAQLIKVILDVALAGKLEWQRFFSSGGPGTAAGCPAVHIQRRYAQQPLRAGGGRHDSHRQDRWVQGHILRLGGDPVRCGDV